MEEEVTIAELENMYKAYLRGLLRQLERLNSAMGNKDYAEAEKLLAELIEDTKSDIQDSGRE